MGRRVGKICLNKKGSLVDIVFIGIVLLFFGMIALIGLTVSSGINDRIQDSNVFNANGKVATNQIVKSYTNGMDNAFLFFTIGISLVTLVLAALVRIHPIFIPFFFIGLIFVIIISAILSNIYQEMAADPNLLAAAGELTFITNILSILPMIIGVFGIFLMIVMYKLWDANRI